MKNGNARKHSMGVRILSLILTAVLMFLFVPTVVYAEMANAFTSDGSKTTATETDDVGSTENTDKTPLYTYNGVTYEEISMREETVKHFKLADGSYVAAQYGTPVHYEDEGGQWQDIDNSLGESNGFFANSTARIKFSKSINGSQTLFTLKDGSTKLEMSLIGAIKGTDGIVINGEDSEEETELQKLLNLENLSSRIYYAGILDGVDVEYVVHSLNVKENIIVNEKSDSYAYSFELKLNGMTAELNSDGDIVITETKTGEKKYTIPAPVVYDLNYAVAPKDMAYYTLDGKNGKYILTVTADAEWMNAEEREFPVVIDPTITTDSNSDIEDTFIDPNEEDVICDDVYTILSVNTNKAVYCKVNNLPELRNDMTVINVHMNFMYHSSAGRSLPALQLSRVTSDWSEDTFTYNRYLNNGEGQYGSNIINYTGLDSKFVYRFNITKLALDWYKNPDTNFGVRVEKLKNKAPDYVLDYGFAARLEIHERETVPKLEIYYTNQKGVEDYWSNHTSTLSDAGTGRVNHATGTLNYEIPLTDTTDGLFGKTISLMYNSYLAGKGYVYPYATTAFFEQTLPDGFKLNISETVIKKTYLENESEEEIAYYVYEDEDGTSHDFYESDVEGVYVDNDGLLMTLTVDDNGDITIKNRSKTEKKFVSVPSLNDNVLGAWVMTSITDSHGNSLNITLNDDAMPTTVSVTPNGMSEIHYVDFVYDSVGRLSGVYNSATKEVVILFYSLYTLISIARVYGTAQATLADAITCISVGTSEIFPDYKLINITYDNSNNLRQIVDIRSLRWIEYTWQEYQVVSVKEMASETEGQCVTFDYGLGYTSVRTSGSDDVINTDDDIITRYVYDNKSRVVSSYSYSASGMEIYGANSGKYGTEQNNQNSITEITSVGGTSTNYLLNGAFEDSLNRWTVMGNVKIQEQSNRFDSWGDYSARVYSCVESNGTQNATTSQIYQLLALTPGTYTLSLQYASLYGETSTAQIMVVSLSSLINYIHTSSILLSEGETSTGDKFVCTTFTIPETENETERYYIVIEISSDSVVNSAQSIMIDNIMLEKNVGSSEFTLVKYGNFEATSMSNPVSLHSIGSVWGSSGEETVTTENAVGLFGNVLRLDGKTYDSYAKQTIYAPPKSLYTSNSQYTNSDASFTVAGFAKSDTVTEIGEFCIRVEVVYYQGENKDDIIETYTFEFSDYCDDWQFTSGSFTTDLNSGDYWDEETKSYVYKDYDVVKEINVYCDFSNQPVDSYAFFDNISVVDSTLSGRRQYLYDEQGNLRMLDTGNYEEYFEYDEDGNLVRHVNNLGELIEYEYTSGVLTAVTSYEFLRYFGCDCATLNPICSCLVNGKCEGMSPYLDITCECIQTEGQPWYPYWVENPDLYITKFPKSKTVYTYNSVGLKTKEESYAANYNSTGAVVKVNGARSMVTESEYIMTDGSVLFGILCREGNGVNKSIRYIYDETKARLAAIVNEISGTGTCYSYDFEGKLVSVMPASYSSSDNFTSISDGESVSYTYNRRGFLSNIKTESTEYNFTYDAFGNQSAVSVGNDAIVSYEYNENDGKLVKINYSNGFSVEYVYNTLDLVSEIWYTDNTNTRFKAYAYEYTIYGQVYKFYDCLANTTTAYQYDTEGNLTSFTSYDSTTLSNVITATLSYDEQSRTEEVKYSIKHSTETGTDYFVINKSFGYDISGKINREQLYTDKFFSSSEFTYDALGRLTKKEMDIVNGIDITTQYFYRNVGAEGTEDRIYQFRTQVGEEAVLYSYLYDSQGNIKSINDGLLLATYVYDNRNQLVRENNYRLDETYVYVYDNAGNMLLKHTYSFTTAASPTGLKSTEVYTYGNSEWGDQLTEYNGTEITYDAIGNPTYYYNGFEYSWQGRSLVGASNGTTTYSFTYDENNRRQTKTVNGFTTTYYYDGSLLVAEMSSNGEVIVYLYDTFGSPIGFCYREELYGANEWDTYFYGRNVQGDIVYVYSSDGVQLLEYTYDAWGNFTKTYTNGGEYTTVGYNNLTYRGYYYDYSLGFYVLTTRYYDPNVCRFINADTANAIVGSPCFLTDKNLYAYCDNNPVMRIDQNGEWWVFANAFIGAVVGAASKIVSNISTGQNLLDGVVGAAVGGAVYGAIVATTGDVVAAGFAGAAAESLANEVSSYIPGVSSLNGSDTTKELTGENIGESIANILTDAAANGIIYTVTGKLASKVIPNSNFIKPTKFWDSFVSNPALKAHAQTLVQGTETYLFAVGVDLLNALLNVV